VESPPLEGLLLPIHQAIASLTHGIQLTIHHPDSLRVPAWVRTMQRTLGEVLHPTELYQKDTHPVPTGEWHQDHAKERGVRQASI
jgi:hypothetical protein